MVYQASVVQFAAVFWGLVLTILEILLYVLPSAPIETCVTQQCVLLDFGHSGIDPLQTRQEGAGAFRKSGEVWWEGRHQEIRQPPIPLQLSPHLPAIFLLSGCGENGQSRVEYWLPFRAAV